MRAVVATIVTVFLLPAADVALADPRDDAVAAQAAWRDAAIGNKACVDVVYSSPDFAPLLPHFPRRMAQATDEQRADTSLPNDSEIRAIQATHPRMQACRDAMIKAITPPLPTVAPILTDQATKSETQLLALVQKRQSWGQYTTNVISIGAETELALRAENRRLGTLAAKAVITQENANTAAYAREMQMVKSGIGTPRPAVTGCSDVGKGCAPN